MKELLDKLMQETGPDLTITIDLDLSSLAHPHPDKSFDHPPICGPSPEKPCPEMDAGGQTRSFMDDVCPKDIPCPEMGLDGLPDEIAKMLKDLTPQDFDGEGFSKEKIEVYPSSSDSCPLSSLASSS